MVPPGPRATSEGRAAAESRAEAVLDRTVPGRCVAHGVLRMRPDITGPVAGVGAVAADAARPTRHGGRGTADAARE
ncbi:hypothetical protein GCM10010236_35570 [Streptomyces eurythermus]|nr:hypothetical protein GCM10010236_35570 [Streptomyces eurythermus]